jgi:hypothetical protein
MVSFALLSQPQGTDWGRVDVITMRYTSVSIFVVNNRNGARVWALLSKFPDGDMGRKMLARKV